MYACRSKEYKNLETRHGQTKAVYREPPTFWEILTQFAQESSEQDEVEVDEVVCLQGIDDRLCLEFISVCKTSPSFPWYPVLCQVHTYVHTSSGSNSAALSSPAFRLPAVACLGTSTYQLLPVSLLAWVVESPLLPGTGLLLPHCAS